jgi:ABC-type Fe3+/spermidine/putrescine transport system ATPase subunit
MPVIQVHQLTKVYSETEVPVHAVNGIDLAFEKGEFTAIVGPSGSGKTTLLNMIGGLETDFGIRLDSRYGYIKAVFRKNDRFPAVQYRFCISGL